MWMSPLNGKEKEKRMKGNWNETLQWKKKMKGKGNETLVWNIIDDWWKWTSHCYMDLWFVRLMCCMKWWKYYMSRSLYFLLFDHRHICLTWNLVSFSLSQWSYLVLCGGEYEWKFRWIFFGEKCNEKSRFQLIRERYKYHYRISCINIMRWSIICSLFCRKSKIMCIGWDLFEFFFVSV